MVGRKSAKNSSQQDLQVPIASNTRRSARLAQVTNNGQKISPHETTLQVKDVKFTKNVKKIGQHVSNTILEGRAKAASIESRRSQEVSSNENVENKSTDNQRSLSRVKSCASTDENDEKEPIECVDCHEIFQDINSLTEHELGSHEKEANLICQMCQKVFTRKYHLERHLLLTPCSGNPPPAHPCEVCGKVYTRKDNLREHLRVHSGEVTRKKKFSCQYCPKMFHGASLLKIHERTHTGEKPFQCDFCPKAFPSGGALTKHRRIHTGEKPYSCPNCDVRFSLKGTLNRHMRIHTGIRPHKCSFCDKQFIQIGGLKAHMFYHTGQNGFKCDMCDKTFNRKARLQMHVKYVHEKDRPFECTECSKKFTRKEDLNRHAVLHTGEKPHICSTCGKKFAIKPSLKLHILTHTREQPRSCHECGRAFIRRDCLLRHVRKKHKDKVEQFLAEEKAKEEADARESRPLELKTLPPDAPRVLTEKQLVESISQLLNLLVDEKTLKSFGYPETPIDTLLESVIKRCGHTPVDADAYEYYAKLRENSKILFTILIDDTEVKQLLNNQTVDEVILYFLKLAKQ